MFLLALLVLLFLTGVVSGVLLLRIVMAWSGGLIDPLVAFLARQELSAIERDTISRMTDAAWAARSHRTPPGADIVEGTVVDVDARTRP